MSEENIQPQPVEQRRYADRLQIVLLQKIGNHFQQHLTLTLLADDLYWILNLAEQGMNQREKEWREKSKGRMDVSEMLSLASFKGSFESLIKATGEAKVSKPKRKK